MKPFKDNKGRQWEIDVNVSSIRRVKDVTGIRLDGDQQELAVKLNDVINLCNVLFVLCKPQADAQGVTDEQFGESLAGDVLGAAVDALREAITDFFPSRQRTVMTAALAKAREVETALIDRAGRRVADLNVENIVRDIEKELIPSNGSAMNLPASAASIPAPSPSDS